MIASKSINNKLEGVEIDGKIGNESCEIAIGRLVSISNLLEGIKIG